MTVLQIVSTKDRNFALIQNTHLEIAVLSAQPHAYSNNIVLIQ